MWADGLRSGMRGGGLTLAVELAWAIVDGQSSKPRGGWAPPADDKRTRGKGAAGLGERDKPSPRRGGWRGGGAWCGVALGADEAMTMRPSARTE